MRSDNLSETNNLLRRIENGDARAIDLLYRRYIKRVEAWTHGRIPDTARILFDTEGVAHEVLAKSLLRAAEGTVMIRSSFRAYLRKSIRNRLIDLRRSERNRFGEINDDIPDPGPLPLEEILEREFEAHVGRGILRLPQEQQSLLRLRFEHNFSYQQIAQRLHLDSGDAARMRVNRVLQRLRDELVSTA